MIEGAILKYLTNTDIYLLSVIFLDPYFRLQAPKPVDNSGPLLLQIENNIIGNITACCHYKDTGTDLNSVHSDQPEHKLHGTNSAVLLIWDVELTICISFWPKENKKSQQKKKKNPKQTKTN